MACLFCGDPIDAARRGGRAREYCDRRCRQAGFRLRRRMLGDGVEPAANDARAEDLGDASASADDDATPAPSDASRASRSDEGAPSTGDERRAAAGDAPVRVAYADPPYPGLARRYYGREPTFGGEVDHLRLVAGLVVDFPDGWALSTSSEALRDLLPLCPPGSHVCAWVKPAARVGRRTAGLHATWEPLIVCGGRQRPPGVRDALVSSPARGWGTLTGRKPLAFCAWLFRALGLRAGDDLVDLFPGSGMVGRAWHHVGAVAGGRRGELGAGVELGGMVGLIQRVRCATCHAYAWGGSARNPVVAPDGELHHPNCPVVQTRPPLPPGTSLVGARRPVR